MSSDAASDVTDAIVLAAYAAMALELGFLAVPSAVSTRRLLSRAEAASPSAWLATALPFALGLLLFAVPPIAALAPHVLEYLLPLPQLSRAPVRSAGVTLLVAGKLLTAIALPPLRRALREERLAREGAFAYCRHPIVVGLVAFGLGGALIYPCVVLLAGMALYALHMHRRVLLEETLLDARFPGAYAQYTARVPRYLGRRS